MSNDALRYWAHCYCLKYWGFFLAEILKNCSNFYVLDKLCVKENYNLARHTSFKTGGNCAYYARVNSDNIEEAINFANDNKLKIKLLAGGFNTLVLDELEESLLIHFFPEKFVELRDDYIYLKANTSLNYFLNYVANLGMSKYEFLAGIPGTLGGAICMNAGVLNPDRVEISEYFLSGKIIDLDTGKIEDYDFDRMEFSYRNSILQRENKALLDLKLKKNEIRNSEILKREIEEIKNKRKSKQAKCPRNAGSIFKAINGDPAWIYIEKCGLKNYSINGAKISEEHSNWIVNEGGAKSADILNLIEHIEKCVYGKFGLKLEREIKIIS